MERLTEPLVVLSRGIFSTFGESYNYRQRVLPLAIGGALDCLDNQSKEYLLKLAVISRRMCYRKVGLYILTVCANDDKFKGENFIDTSTRKSKLAYYVDNLVLDCSDLLDVLMIHSKNFPHRPIPSQLRKLLKKKLEGFNSYFNSDDSDYSIRDAVCMLRPRPNTKKKDGYFRDVVSRNYKIEYNVGYSSISKKDTQKFTVDRELLECLRNSKSTKEVIKYCDSYFKESEI